MDGGLENLQKIMQKREDGHLEFKEAKTQFDLNKLLDYCVALANEKGGDLVLGVTDKRPRRIVGTKALGDLQEAELTALRDRIPNLRNIGVIERVGRGRGTKHILSRRFYDFLDKKGLYTRRKGLNRETNKALLLQHIDNYAQTGSQMKELKQVLPALSYSQVQSLLYELQKEGKIRHTGRTKSSRWYPVPEPKNGSGT